MQMLRCFRPAQMKPYLAKKEFFLHLPIMFNVKAKKSFVSLANTWTEICDFFPCKYLNRNSKKGVADLFFQYAVLKYPF